MFRLVPDAYRHYIGTQPTARPNLLENFFEKISNCACIYQNIYLPLGFNI